MLDADAWRVDTETGHRVPGVAEAVMIFCFTRAALRGIQ
jgi:hypothetical protein